MKKKKAKTLFAIWVLISKITFNDSSAEETPDRVIIAWRVCRLEKKGHLIKVFFSLFTESYTNVMSHFKAFKNDFSSWLL